MLTEGLTDAFQLLTSGDPVVLRATGRTILISLVAVGGASFVGILLATWLARRWFPGAGIVVFAFRAAVGIPTVLIGAIGLVMFSRRGPLGELDLLFTNTGIVVCEFCLALPIVFTFVHGAMREMDPRVGETALTLGAGRFRRLLTYVSETRLAIALALLTAFARCSTELGIAKLVGGNLKHTQTLATLTSQELGRAEYARGIATSLILLLIAIATTCLIAWFGRGERRT